MEPAADPVTVRYTSAETCPKCGSETIQIRFLESTDEYPAGLLRLHCSGCGFGATGEWRVLTMDAAPPQ